ncbi:DUF3820 family protein [Crocinitomicaceae bacterium]|jgi:uncharacterized protein|nr:DUF3820 family protein [Crocinitomicaceae bacterium]MDG1347784.1 DUF3820 family protein [Crocinitomicaceae bacterium]MDG2464418.1 DUF3820 family protein [Crocinitomicaceae bacterium]
MNNLDMVSLANAKMPYGKYKDRLLVHIPEAYLVWYSQKGFPKGKLGDQLAVMLEIKMNGLEDLIYPLIKK